MAEEEKKLVKWTGEFGWNTVFSAIVAGSLIVGAVMAVGSVKTASENSSAAVVELRNIVGEIQKANASFSERITRVESRLDNVEKQGDRIERKIDIIGAPPPVNVLPQVSPRR